MMLSILYSGLILSAFFVGLVTSDWNEDFTAESSDDLAPAFKSAPDLRPPAWNISVCEKDLVTPGYWFTAPYTALRHLPHALEFQPGQIGPAIFDGEGELVWSGAALFANRNIFDFKVVDDSSHGNATALSLIFGSNHFRHTVREGAGLRLDKSYQTIGQTAAPVTSVEFNKHEYNIIDGGRSALIITTFPTESQGIWVYNNGFIEVDIATGRILFEWDPLPDLSISASYDDRPQPRLKRDWQYGAHDAPQVGPLCGFSEMEPWDWIHLNSVEKTAGRDYIVSARATSAIYKISHLDGAIMWQLGGKNSSFVLDGFNFSHQHDARVRAENSTTTIISLHNNAADDKGVSHQTSEWTSAMLVALDMPTMTATLLRRWDRPDHGLSIARGNMQILPNSNAFVSWSDNGYISEFTEDGRLVLEARFASHRFTTYRAYKFNFTGSPITPPDLISYAYGTSAKRATTIHYVSWNGATEVRSWRFFGSASNSSFSIIGSASRSGFETTFMSDGYIAYVYVEGIAADGTMLGRSHTKKTKIPVTFTPEPIRHHQDIITLLLEILIGFILLCAAMAWFFRARIRRENVAYKLLESGYDL